MDSHPVINDVPRAREIRPGAVRIATGDDEYLAVGRDGWAYFYRPHGHDVRLRVLRNRAGRFVVAALVVQALERGRPWTELSPSAISATDLRNLPLGKIETILNSPDLSHELDAITAAGAGVTFDPQDCPPGAASRRARRVSLWMGRKELRLPPQTGRGRSDDFYRQVAAVYASAAVKGPRPVEAIAEANTVAVTTVHGWLKEARRRGILPPAKRRPR